ncbi:unnamed protein product [Meganyctiphanes norvegica]|uniref:Uncharacterized protein n=1 Tax=Meganyctiphanes norvegica TaxID=48144 RepID=A0AAV2RV55_MEGNR
MWTQCAVLVIVALALGEALPLAQEGYEYGPPPPAPYAPAYEHIPILQDDRTHKTGYGEYTFAFKTGNDITRSESGSQNDGQISDGAWNYISPEGTPIALNFVADHGGYQPVGDHLPVAPVHDFVLPVAPELPYERTDTFIH